jgi:hypothetical protein
MINRQRFGIFLVTSAFFAGLLLPAAAAEFTPAPGAAAPAAVSAPAPVAATPAPAPLAVAPAPAKVANSTPATHPKHKIVARIAAPSESIQSRPAEYEIASTAPVGVPCRACGYPLIFGIAY